MKRAALKRKSPLRALGLMKKRPRKSRGEADDKKYLDFVRSLPCCAPELGVGGLFTRCSSPKAFPIEAHHLTGAGMGLKADDKQTMPLCSHHHRALHNFDGPFGGWSREERHLWQLEQIEKTYQLYLDSQ